MQSAPAEVIVRGRAELERAFMEVRREVAHELKPALLVAAEPVRSESESLTVSNVENIGPKWSRMRIGMTPKAIYVAPRSRRRGGSPRKNLAGLLAAQMEAALKDKEEEVVAAVTVVIDVAAARNGFL